MRSSFFSKSLIPLFLIFIFYLFVKHDGFAIRVSDTNIYFYTAIELLNGRTLYNDIFFTNLPLFPYISILYGALTGWRLDYFFAIPIIETIIIAILIYKISLLEIKTPMLSYAPVVVYLFSFLVLATSDHETGVFIANIFSLLAYYFFLKNKLIFSGIFLSLTILTKVYFLPIVLALILYSFLSHKKKCLRLTTTFAITSFLILSFFVVQSEGQIIRNLFAYSSARHEGVSKMSLLQFFAFKDFVLFILLLVNFYLIKTKNFLGFVSLFSLPLIVFYRDIYFLYLNFFAPFVTISLVYWIPKFKKNTNLIVGFLALILISFIINISSYLSSYKNLQKINTIDTLVEEITKQNPTYLYGINSITPALSYLSGVPLLHDIVDTNENRFLTGNLDAQKLTRAAQSEKTIFVTKSAVYPEYQISELFMSTMFDKSQLSNCTVTYSTPVDFEGIENRLSLALCP